MALRKCACIDTLYTELDWLDRFQAAKNDGFEAVEFWDWRIRDLDATREAAEKAGIAISGFKPQAIPTISSVAAISRFSLTWVCPRRRRTSSSWMWRLSSRRCTVMPSAPPRWASTAAASFPTMS